MVKRVLLKTAPLLLILILVLSITGPVSAEKKLVVDLAGFFSASDEAKLTQEAQALSEKYKMDIVIVTTKDTKGKSSMAFADDYFDANGYGVGDGKDGILFLLDYYNRQAYISTSGSAIRYLTDAKIKSILDDVLAGGLSSGNNLGAVNAFLSSTAKILTPNTLSPIEGILGFIAAGLTGLGFFAGTRSQYKGKPRPNIFEYRSNSIASIGITSHNLVNSFVTSRIIPVPSPGTRSGGGSSTHTSSGGGRSF